MFLYYLLPNFSLFDLQGAIVNRRDIDLVSEVMVPLIYGIIWAVILFLAGLVKFQKKALTVGN